MLRAVGSACNADAPELTSIRRLMSSTWSSVIVVLTAGSPSPHSFVSLLSERAAIVAVDRCHRAVVEVPLVQALHRHTVQRDAEAGCRRDRERAASGCVVALLDRDIGREPEQRLVW